MIALQVTGMIVGIVALYVLSCIRILFEYQRGVISFTYQATLRNTASVKLL